MKPGWLWGMSPTQNIGTRVYIVAMVTSAVACFVPALLHWHSSDPVKFVCYLIAAILVSPLKVSLPGIQGTLSVNFLFTLIGILEMSLPETLLLGVVTTLAQFYWKPTGRLRPVQLIFNLSQVTVAIAAAYGAYILVSLRVADGPGPLALLVAAVTQFMFNTSAMSAIIGLTENKSILKVWSQSYLWSSPYFMVGAAIAGLVHFLNTHIGWQASLLVLPPIYLLFRSYRLYLGRLEAEKVHAEKVSHLHLRTIEALALAIEAKDQTTGDHLQRVRVYAMGLARELALSEEETEALRAASVLHDIGKLAVPEHIIAKPGKLSPDEFEKMKIHPIVGAEILEQVDFPYPVVPIVRAHHEKWDGSGYPFGLRGEQIPIGARILSAVDCLDALASDRQYRPALPLDVAMAKVQSEAGTSFDPQVVAMLSRHYRQLEKLAHEQPIQPSPKLSTEIKIEHGLAPDAGFAETGARTNQVKTAAQSYAELSAASLKEIDALLPLRNLVTPLRPPEIWSLAALRISSFIPYDALASYIAKEGILTSEFVTGDHARIFSSLRIPVGEGLVGWVAHNTKEIVNGNPAVEPGYPASAVQQPQLQSALALPMLQKSTVRVVALYRGAPDAFTRDELNLLRIMTSRLERMFENCSPDSAPQRAPSAIAKGASASSA